MSSIKKCVDVMLGIAIGDAFAAGYENIAREQISATLDLASYHRNPHPESVHQAGHYTDDAQMSLAIAELLCSQQKFDQENLAKHLYRAYYRDKRTGYSDDIGTALEKSSSGNDFLTGVNRDSEKSDSTVRAVPIGLIPDMSRVIEYAVINSETTHNTPTAIASSVAVALASRYFFYDLGHPESLFESCLDHMADFDAASVDYLDELSRMETLDADLLFGEDYENFGVPTNAIEVAGAALYLLTTCHDNPTDILREAVLLGGNTATTASISLGITAGKTGLEKIPELFFEELENGAYGRDYVIDTGKRLATMAPMEDG